MIPKAISYCYKAAQSAWGDPSIKIVSYLTASQAITLLTPSTLMKVIKLLQNAGMLGISLKMGPRFADNHAYTVIITVLTFQELFLTHIMGETGTVLPVLSAFALMSSTAAGVMLHQMTHPKRLKIGLLAKTNS